MRKYVICFLAITITFVLLVSMASLPFNAEAQEESASGQTELVTEGDETEEGSEQTAVEMYVSAEGLELIKDFEGYAQYPYSDYSQWSIGYGSYVCGLDEDPYEIYPNGISIMEAEEKLLATVGKYIAAVNKFALEYNVIFTQNQFDALVSFTYNVGANVWKRDPSNFTIKRLLISGDYTQEEIADAFYLWRNAGGKENAGLAKRRKREAALFNSDICMADPSQNGYDVAYYITNSTYLTVRTEASSDATSLGSIRKHSVIPILYTDESGKYGYTCHAAYFGWVELSRLIPIDEKGTVSVLDENMKDEQGVYYTLDHVDMEAAVGDASENTNNSQYGGTNNGYISLNKYILCDNRVYILTEITSDSFTANEAIKKIFIPSSVEEIAENAFDGSSLTDIYYEGGSVAEEYAKASVYNATNCKCINSHKFGTWSPVHAGDADTPRKEGCTCSVCGDMKYRTAVALSVATPPEKTEYYIGDEFTPEGIKVLLTFDDGSTCEASSELSFEGFDSTELGTKQITVKHSVFEASFTIRVNEVALVSITVKKTPTNTTYVEGTSYDFSGLSVVANYNNGTSEPISEYHISECDINTVGKQIITITYNGFKASFSVTVKARSLTSVKIVSNPYKLEYYCGEEFDTSGLAMMAYYDNDTSELVEDGFTVKRYDSSEPGRIKVRLYYGSYYKNVYVDIVLNRFISEHYGIDGDEKCVVTPGTTVSDFVSGFEDSDRITVYGMDGKVRTGNAYVGNDSYAVLTYNEDELATLRLEVFGDFSGDGVITYSDYILLSAYFTLSGNEADYRIGDINGDGTVTLTDLVILLSEIRTKNEDDQFDELN